MWLMPHAQDHRGATRASATRNLAPIVTGGGGSKIAARPAEQPLMGPAKDFFPGAGEALPHMKTQWPADKVERRPLSALVPAVRNARTP